MNVDERRLNVMLSQIPARVPAPAVLDHLCDVCSAVFPRSVVPARGMAFISFFSFLPSGAFCCANASDSYIKELADRIHSIENKLESEGSLTQDEIDRLLTPGSHRAYNGIAPLRKQAVRERFRAYPQATSTQLLRVKHHGAQSHGPYFQRPHLQTLSQDQDMPTIRWPLNLLL